MDLTPTAAAELLREVARFNLEDEIRRGSLLHFGSTGQLVMTGDMHGNLRNFEKLKRFCALDTSPGRYVILHELIHQEPTPGIPLDLSIDLLIAAAQWKRDFPDNVFFLQSNHELSQLRRHEITKGGRSVLLDFERGVQERFGRGADLVLAAVNDYIASLPLAARTSNGIFMAHSLPDSVYLETFDYSIFDRLPREEDYEPRGGPAYQLVWGRFQSPMIIDEYARRLQAETIIVGHTPQETGYCVVGQMLILASDHIHGVFLPIDLRQKYTVAQLEARVQKFVAVP